MRGGVLLLALIGMCYLILGCIRYRKISERGTHACVLTANLKKEIEKECFGIEDGRELIKRCDRIVCRNLRFAYKNQISKGKANCVGYAQMTSDAVNYAFQLNHLLYKAYPVYGRVHLFGIDLHPFVMGLLPSKYKAFFKDHDYVEILLDGEIINVDSSFRDLFGMEYVHLVEDK